ncbi:MAG: carboxylesterase family protein [Emcibacteraceae bacterium]|nr:carboxylesterase family protein [Emcibacteraceae bacterium]MDG1995114.1 carboxylesterase family protein [Emcibacteraceae bacterium]
MPIIKIHFLKAHDKMLFLSILFLLFFNLNLAHAQTDTSPVIATENGAVYGVREKNGTRAFLGIPFALKPIKEARFKEAVPHLSMTGNIMAQKFPPACPQNQGNVNWYKSVVKGVGKNPNIIPSLENISEDCLYLNIWTPEGATGDLPVMVWIHGGGNVNGWSYEPNYRGHNLSNKEVVVVSVQYRLGDLGFLPTAFNSEDDPSIANWGISDLVASLKWIQKNIHNFGGNAENITLFGESAGGGNIAGLMLTPTAKGLFHKAIIQSGAVGPKATINLETARETAKDAYNNASINTLEKARETHWKEMISLHRKADNSYYHYVISDGAYTLAEPEYISDVPLIIGSNKNENLMYSSATPALDITQSLKAYKRGDDIQEYLNQYSSDPKIQADYFYTSEGFLCPSLEITTNIKSPSYVYDFTREREGASEIGAYHGAEIPYVFNTHDDWLPTDDIDRELTEVMMGYWVNFANTGQPNGENVPHWETYSTASTYRQEFGDRIGKSQHSPENFCALLIEKNIE